MKKYKVVLYDGFDNCWVDCSGEISQEEAKELYNEKTANGTKNTKYDDIDYYKIVQVED